MAREFLYRPQSNSSWRGRSHLPKCLMFDSFITYNIMIWQYLYIDYHSPWETQNTSEPRERFCSSRSKKLPKWWRSPSSFVSHSGFSAARPWLNKSQSWTACSFFFTHGFPLKQNAVPVRWFPLKRQKSVLVWEDMFFWCGGQNRWGPFCDWKTFRNTHILCAWKGSLLVSFMVSRILAHVEHPK